MATFYSGYNNTYRLILDVSESSYSIENNTSKVSWSLKVSCGSNYAQWNPGPGDFSVVINGSTVLSLNNPSFWFSGPNQTIGIGSGSLTVSHNDDGSKSISCSASYKAESTASYLPGSMSLSGSLALTTIPRASSVSSIDNNGMVINGSNALTVNIQRASASFTHTVDFNFNGYTCTIQNQGTSCTYTIPLSWIGAFGNGGSGSKTGTITITTYNGSTQIGTKTSEFTLTCPSASTISSSTSQIECNGTNTIDVSISRSLSAFTHKVKWQFGNYTHEVSNIATNASYAPPTSWLDAISSANSGFGSVYVTTYYGTQQIGATVSKRFDMTVPNYEPNFSGVTVSVVQDEKISDWGIYVSKLSKAKFVFNGASGKYGSTIKRYAMKIDGISYENFEKNEIISNVLNGSGTLDYGVSVRDTRDKEKYLTGSINVYEYIKPSYVSHSIYRYNGTQEDDEGQQLFFNLKFTYGEYNGNNSTTNKIYIKKSTDATFTEYGTFTNGQDLVISDYVFDYHYSYIIRATVTDKLGNSIQIEKTLLSADCLIDADGEKKAIGLLKVANRENFVQVGGSLEVDNVIENPNGSIAHYCKSGQGSTGYIKFATITIKGTYANTPIIFELIQRHKERPTTLYVAFANENSLDPSLRTFMIDGDSASLFIKKSATSVYDLYVKKIEAYDGIVFNQLKNNSDYMSDRLTITWVDEFVSTLPSGYTEALYFPTPIAGTIDNGTITSGGMKDYKSFIGSIKEQGNTWYNMISVRHRNGNGDGNLYGMFIRSLLEATTSSLVWNQQNNGTWGADRTILDSANFANFAFPSTTKTIATNSNCNSITETGMYILVEGSSWTNGPNTYINGIMLVFKFASNNVILQIYSQYDGELWTRVYWYGSWGTWFKLNKFKYSTNEQWTGQYWIDGNKIYSKTVTWSNLDAGSISKAHGISNIKNIVDYKIFAVNSGGEMFEFPCVYYGNGSSGTFYDTYMFITKTYINCKSNVAWSSHTFYATIYYTKT